MPNKPPALTIDGVSKSYGDLKALDNVSLTLPRGQITAILGPNGAGKTTLMEICEGLITCDVGNVAVLGLNPIRQAQEYRMRIGVMVQDGGLPLSARPGELIHHVAAMYPRGASGAELMAALDIEPFAKTPIRRLSGGQRQRVALALALAGAPELVFLDEPSTGLDPAARRVVWKVISDLKASGVSVILTTHFMEEAQELADHVVIMDQGKILTQGTLEELLRIESDSAVQNVTLVGDISPALLAELTGWANRHGLAIPGRTLEDVFLELTGKSLQATAAN